MSIDIGQAGGIPNGAIFVLAASGNVANASAVATISSSTGRINYLLGCAFLPMGATAGAIVNATITGFAFGSFTIPVAAPTGIAAAGTPVILNFGAGIPAASGNNIVVTMPALGAGNTNAAVIAWGFAL